MEERLWDFSLKFYASAAVQKACLELQDECGADVNLLLFLLFRASQGVRLTVEQVVAVDEEVAAWRSHTTVPLRKIRRLLKGADLRLDAAVQEDFRDLVKKIELQSEKIEQQRLEAMALPDLQIVAPTAAARGNLSAYAEFLKVEIGQPAFDVLLQRLDALLAGS